MSTYRAAVIGSGGRSGAHIEAYKHIGRAEVVACADLVLEKAEKRAAEFGLEAYADSAEMIKAEKPDLVHICTPPTARADLLTLCSDLGVPGCTIEKPLATGVVDWHELCALEASTKTKIAICHQCRWQENLVKCQDALKSGKLGEVKFLEFSAGMNISGQGTHILNYGMSLNGDSPVVRVFGAASGDSEMNSVHPAPDTTIGYLVFENGVRALWNNGPTAPWTCGDPNVSYQHVRAAAYADKGRVLWEEFGGWEIISPDGAERGRIASLDERVVKNIRAQAAFHEAMFDWLEDDGKPAGTNFKQSLHEWAVVLALYASTVERRPIELAGFDPPEDLFDRLATVLGRANG